MKNMFFFVEGDNKVIKTKGSLHNENYKNLITITEIKKILKPYKLKSKKSFHDMFVFFPSNKNFELTVWLKSIDNFYDDEKTKIKDINFYTTVVEIIILEIGKKLSQRNITLIQSIMENIKLNIYYTENEKHYKNIEEFKNLLRQLNLYIEK